MDQAGETLRGADPINDELEVGYDQRFEQRWHRWEIAGRALMVLVVAAGLAGLLGSGPFSHERLTRPDGTVRAVDYEPLTRYQTPTQITLHLHPDGNNPIRLRLSSTFVEPLGVSGDHPAPLLTTADNGDLTILVSANPAKPVDLLRLDATPTQIGPVHLSVQAGDETPVSWTMVVLP